MVEFRISEFNAEEIFLLVLFFLYLLDAIPVLFFGIAAVMLGVKLRSAVFFAGALLCFLAGFGKVLWKFLIATTGKDVELLGMQLRYVMPAGFLLMVVGAFMADRSVVNSLVNGALKMPSILFFIIAVCALTGMVVCARKFDRRDVRSSRGLISLRRGVCCWVCGLCEEEMILLSVYINNLGYCLYKQKREINEFDLQLYRSFQ